MNESVLILDDSLTVRMDLLEAFEGAGYRVLPCATAAEARDTLTREHVDIVILDVLLPDADGVDVLRELRATPSTEHAVILMLSSEADVADRIRGLRTGADEYVGKPYDSGYVVARAGELLRGAAPGSDAPVVLVIDDSATFREELRSSCEEAGLDVITAADGAEGLRLAAVHRPDAVIVDSVMPGIDGATVIRRIRLDAALRRVPCMLLTASDDEGAELRALDAGADAFARKELDVSIVIAKLEALLRQSTPTVSVTDDTRSVLGPKKVLAVDDSPTYLHGLGDLLRGEGFDVVMAGSGEEAIELLAVETVDCILLDLMMPGLGGEETCRRIKEAPFIRDVPLLMLTALEDREAMIGALAAGADDYIPKSSELEVLLARVRAQLRRRQFEDENRRMREELLQRELEAHDARAAQELAETRAALVDELERKNQELEAFSYSVSHDLRAPLRSIDGFSQALVEDYAGTLDERGVDYLRRVRAAAQRMGELIDDLLELSRVTRAELHREHVDLAQIAHEVVAALRRHDPDRRVAVTIDDAIDVFADRRLMAVVLENLIGNAWKYTTRTDAPEIEIRREAHDGNAACVVRDNGDGFDMKYVDKLFVPFQRLHTDAEYPGTGIGLATVHRIVDRHGGRVWASAAVGAGATFSFTIPETRRGRPE